MQPHLLPYKDSEVKQLAWGHTTLLAQSSTGGHSGSLEDRLQVPHTTVYL